METLITRYPVSFTDAAALPVLIPAAPSAGVDTYSHRWIPARSDLAAGSSISVLPNEVKNGAGLAQGTTARRPVLTRAGDEAWITFDGVDDALSVAFAAPQPFSFAMVTRLRSTTAKTLLRMGGALQVVSDPASTGDKYTVRGGPANIGVAVNPADGAWHLLAGVYSSASSLAYADGVSKAGDGGTLAATLLSFGDTTVGVGNTDYDIAEIIIWPTALTLSQLGQVRTAMRAAHPTLLS